MSVTDSSIGSSIGSHRGRTGSTNSTDSHGMGQIEMTFDDDTHHYDKSHECPSDIILGKVSNNKDITDLIQKIGR